MSKQFIIDCNPCPLDIVEDHRAYYSKSFGERVLFELFSNAYNLIRGVYIFRHFDQYVMQMNSDNSEDKKEEYWNASYFEKLMDYVRVITAFENYNKAILIQKGYVVHKIEKTEKTKALWKMQNKGIPIKISELKEVSKYIKDRKLEKFYLSSLGENFKTLTLMNTLSDSYQEIIGLDSELLYHLKELNKKRNKVHFYTEFKGAFLVDLHIEQIKFLKEKSIETLKKPLDVVVNAEN